MNIFINGEATQCESTNIAEMLEELEITTAGMAIAEGERIIPRSKWNEHQLTQGIHLTLIRATQGG